MPNITRSALDALSLTNFPNNTSQQISPADLRDWLDNGIDSFVTQKDSSRLENVIYENQGSGLAAGASVNLALATGNYLHITGAFNGITSFGTVPAGGRFVLVFDGICTLTDSATLILPGGSDITTAAGDCAMLVSEGSGNWRMVGFFPISGGGGGGDITAVTAGTGLSGGGTSGAVTLNLADTAVTPNSYTNANITVDQQGRITAASSGTAGGAPGGIDTEVQFNNLGVFGGIPELTYSGGFVQIETPKIGTGNGNGHLHIHSANSAPTGISNYLTMFWQKATRALGFRSELDTHETYIQLTQPTADRTYTLPDASGNVVLDTATQSLSNKTLTTPTITGIASFDNGASAGEIRLLEPSGSGTNYVAIKAQAMSADYSLTLPVDDGVSGQVLQTNGSGDLSWINLPTASGVSRINTTTAGTAVTGTFALTKSLSVLIPANTFGAGSILECMAIFVRTAGNGNATYRLMINTSDSVTGATSLGTAGVVSNTVDVFGKFYRDLVITNSTTDTSLLFTASSAVSDFGVFTNTTSALSQLSINWTVDQYLIAAINLSVGSTSMYCRAISILQK